MGRGATKSQIYHGTRRLFEKAARELRTQGYSSFYRDCKLYANVQGRTVVACMDVMRASNGETFGRPYWFVSGTPVGTFSFADRASTAEQAILAVEQYEAAFARHDPGVRK